MATLNNEGEELNIYRIQTFGLRDIFPSFFTSCWLRARKPMHEIYERVLRMTQADPQTHAVHRRSRAKSRAGSDARDADDPVPLGRAVAS